MSVSQNLSISETPLRNLYFGQFLMYVIRAKLAEKVAMCRADHPSRDVIFRSAPYLTRTLAMCRLPPCWHSSWIGVTPSSLYMLMSTCLPSSSRNWSNFAWSPSLISCIRRCWCLLLLPVCRRLMSVDRTYDGTGNEITGLSGASLAS